MPAAGLPVLHVESAEVWHDWLTEHGATSDGVLLRIAKKGSRVSTPTYAEAVRVSLAHGWIDSQKGRLDEQSYIQRFTRRAPRSIWSQVNRATAEQLIADGEMTAAGLAQVQAALADGRWDRVYAGSATFEVPPDLRAALDAVPSAAEAFAGFSRTNQYAIVFRAGRVLPANRQPTIDRLVARIAQGWVPHP